MLKTFQIGGIHPQENKISSDKPIQILPLPKQVIISLGQNLGAPSQAVVAKGDEVKVGTLLAKAGGFVSANIHSSVSGKVSKIDEVIDASGYKKPAIYIDIQGDEWEKSIDRSSLLNINIQMDQKAIIQRISEAGIVGLGGATFPTHVKLSPPPGTVAEVLIINAVECEPYLTADHRVLLEKGPEIMVGVRILMKAIGVSKAIIGIENNKKDAIAYFHELASKEIGIDICPLKVQYPQGGEKQLIDACIKRQVASGALPISVGAVVQNVGTTLAVYEAVQKNKPLIERVVTVTGKSLSNPCNLMVRIGTPIADLIKFAGGIPSDTEKIISGGPMMGKTLVSINAPVTKGTSGILLIRNLESRRKEMHDCIRCAKCVQVCPMGLSPNLLMRAGELSMWDKLETEHVMDCIECGSCSYTCPTNRPLLDYIRLGKGKVGTIIRARAAQK